MQNDEVIWQIIRHRHCSFMTKIETGIFCRNPYSLTGVCNRSSCPLANSRYATIRDHDGVFYLYMKTIERAHQPTKLWERVKLPLNYDKALEIIDKHLMYWPKLLVHKTKQRLTKMYQMRIRMRKLALKRREKIMTTPRKDLKREARRADKAEQAAAVERVIEKELLERLKGGTYKDDVNGPIYNYYTEKFVKLLEKIDEPVLEEDNDVVYVEDNLEEEDDMEDFSALDLNASDDDNDDDDDDDEGDAGTDEDDEVTVAIDNKRSRKQSGYGLRKSNKDESSTKLKKKPRVLVEIEHDDTDERQKATH